LSTSSFKQKKYKIHKEL